MQPTLKCFNAKDIHLLDAFLDDPDLPEGYHINHTLFTPKILSNPPLAYNLQ